MLDTQVIMYVIDLLSARIAEARLELDRGDVAEKIVIVGVFVALAIAVGVLVTHAVTGDAVQIAHQIGGSK
jgi:hypothetical protein